MSLSKNNFCRNQLGFTLGELLVVIAIISVLAAIVLGSTNSSRVHAKNRATNEVVRQYILAINVYWTEYGYYPPLSLGHTVCLGDFSDNLCGDNNDTPEDPVLSAALQPYYKGLPVFEPLEFRFGFYTATFEGPMYGCFSPAVGDPCTGIAVTWMLEGTKTDCGPGWLDSDGTDRLCIFTSVGSP
ncbi:MAG: prepilin-type N-terminal cleavage/methylation domain-containing protein [Candidatus Azotimanducaceae bacterium]|jgi:prepilin-type N-terminal cleavage/methylation domain-containing protein